MIGLGCMRLSRDPARDDERARRVLAAALDAGIAVLDTSDAYSVDDGDIGLVRADGAWEPDGRARHLARAG